MLKSVKYRLQPLKLGDDFSYAFDKALVEQCPYIGLANAVKPNIVGHHRMLIQTTPPPEQRFRRILFIPYRKQLDSWALREEGNSRLIIEALHREAPEDADTTTATP